MSRSGGARHPSFKKFVALQVGPVITVTVATMLIGTLLYAVLARITTRADRWFTLIALVTALTRTPEEARS